jgi:hypothetical protein
MDVTWFGLVLDQAMVRVHDGAGVVLKQEVCKEQMNIESKTQLQCAADVITFCSKNKSQEHAVYPNAKRKVI